MSTAPVQTLPSLALSDLVEGRGQVVTLQGRDLVAVLHEGRVHVFDSLCPHAGITLSKAKVKEGALVCAAHGARFDLETGHSLSRFCRQPLKTYASHVADDRVWIALD